jgi:hypothetical protein
VPDPRRFGGVLALSPGSIGVNASQIEAIQLAARFGFEAVEPYPQFLAGLTAAQTTLLLKDLKEKGLVWGAAGLPVEFRREDAIFNDGLHQLAATAVALRRAGVTRVGTWLSPASGSLTCLQNFRRHAERLRAVGEVLGEQGLALPLPAGMGVSGVILADQIKSLDWKARRAEFARATDAATLGEVMARILPLIEMEEEG